VIENLENFWEVKMAVGKEQTESCWAGPLWGKAKPPPGHIYSPLPNCLSDKFFL